MDPRLTKLRQLLESKALLLGDFTLASGEKSKYYFDGKKVTLDPEGITLVGEIFEEIIHESGAEAVGGPAMGANPIVAAVQIVSFERKRPLQGFFVRSERKTHGTIDKIGGYGPAGKKVAIVDDAVTKGNSILDAIQAIKQSGCEVVKVLVLVDRQAGGSKRLREMGYDVEALFTADPSGKLS